MPKNEIEKKIFLTRYESLIGDFKSGKQIFFYFLLFDLMRACAVSIFVVIFYNYPRFQ